MTSLSIVDEKLSVLVDGSHTEFPVSSVVLMVYDQGKVIYEGAFGNRLIDPSGHSERHLPATLETKFRIASISKWVMTLGLMQLVARGDLDLDQDVSTYLEVTLNRPDAARSLISIGNLLSHTSTINDGQIYSIPLPHTLADFFRPGAPFFEDGGHFLSQAAVGTHFNYANLNYGIAASIMEAVSSQRFDHYMRTAVFDPLGIGASYNVALFSPEELKLLAPLYRFIDDRWIPQVDDYFKQPPSELARVENHDSDAKGDAQGAERLHHTTPIDDYRLGTNGTLFSPQGGLRISVRDLGRLMEMVFAKSTPQIGLPYALFTQMMLPRWNIDANIRMGETYNGLMRRWGLSTQIFTHTSQAGRGDRLVPNLDGGPAWYGHLGDAYGLLSGFLFEPMAQQGVIFMIGGTPQDVACYPGRYSSFNGWEEDVLQAAFSLLIKPGG